MPSHLTELSSEPCTIALSFLPFLCECVCARLVRPIGLCAISDDDGLVALLSVPPCAMAFLICLVAVSKMVICGVWLLFAVGLRWLRGSASFPMMAALRCGLSARCDAYVVRCC